MANGCSIDGCDRGHYARGWCERHWRRWKDTGKTGPVEIRQYGRADCSVDGCADPHFSIGLCSKHHQRWRKHSDPTTVVLPERAELVKNPAVHWRLRQDRGPASDYPCQHCGEQAHNWAYDHSEAEPLMDEEGPYSLDQSCYMPLCFSCHTRFDRRTRKLVDAK